MRLSTMAAAREAPAATLRAFLARPLDLATGAIAFFRRRSRARRDYEKLMRLDDRELRDMGIARGDIGRIVWGDADATIRR